MLKHCFTEALTANNPLKITLCSICKYVDDEKQQRYESVYPYPRLRTYLLYIIFKRQPIFYVENIEETIKATIL